MNLHEIVMKLIGPVHPVGDSNVDKIRLENMKALTNLVDMLLFDIGAEAPNAHRPEASMKAVGTHATEFLDNVRSA